MTCRQCGLEFEGNFCSHCGEMAEVSTTTPYPEPPVGEYVGVSCSVSVSDKTLVIWKKYGKTETVVPFQDIAKAFLKKGAMGSFLCIRTADTISKPMATGFSSPSDALSVDFLSRDFEAFLSLYEFIETAATINNHRIPEATKPPARPASVARPIQPEEGNHFASSDGTSPPQAGRNKAPSKRQRIKENKKNGVACCPKCGSTSLTASRQGGGVGKAVVGVFLFQNILGAAAGAIGSNNTRVTCLNCGRKWKL